MAVSPTLRELVRSRANSLCEYCHADERWQFIRFTVDHIEPSSRGGDDSPDNLALACRNCNERRGNRVEAIDPETGQRARLFHPRTDRWNEHFVWSADRIHIIAQSPTGRATVTLLDMNDDRHGRAILRIRQRDAEDGFHPPARRRGRLSSAGGRPHAGMNPTSLEKVPRLRSFRRSSADGATRARRHCFSADSEAVAHRCEPPQLSKATPPEQFVDGRQVHVRRPSGIIQKIHPANGPHGAAGPSMGSASKQCLSFISPRGLHARRMNTG